MFKKIEAFGWLSTITALFLAVTIITIQVILRYVFSIGITWASELARYLIIYISLIGSALVIRKDSHPSVDVMVELLPEKANLYLQIIFDTAIIFFLFFLFREGWKLAVTSTGLTPALRVQWTYPYLAIPIGAAMMFIFSFERIIKSIKNILQYREESK